MLTEGVHFTKSASPYRIGWKAMAVNISDIAAMGGVPKHALVSVGVPRKKSMRYLKNIAKGVEGAARKFRIKVVGGDTNASAKTVVSVALMGEVEKKYLIRRSGARVGDFIFVTGALGEGKRKHLSFIPRLREARVLAKQFRINSMIDLSDGLAMDLSRLAKASDIGARVYKSLIPLSRNSESLDKAIFTGEDFELLFTASIRESRKIIKKMSERLPVTLIGEAVAKKYRVKIIEESGKETLVRPKGFTHL